MVFNYHKSSISSFLVVGALLLSAPLLAQTKGATPNGYELLRQAGAKIVREPSVGLPLPSWRKLTPEETLKSKRLAVARNALALGLVRQALQKPIEFPLMANYPSPGSNLDFQVRELARQLSQESEVRFADGDFVGAMNSKLDIFDLAMRFENGPLVESLSGNAIAGIGRKNFEGVAAKLNSAQCRAAAARLRAILKRQASFITVLKQEQAQTRQLLVTSLPVIQKANLTEEGRAQTGMDEEAATQVAKLTPEQVRRDVNTVFEAVIENETIPYAQRSALTPPATLDANPVLDDTVNSLFMPQTRFRFERSHAQDRLLLGALELHARKVASGEYPKSYAAPVDPFSADLKPLVYRKTNDGFLLYSVGPDGKDDSGTGFEKYLASQDATSREGLARRFVMGEPREPLAPSADRLPPDYQGDIVQKPF